MCLLTNNTHKYIAEKDIVCYKIVYLRDNKIISYWYDFIYELNRKYTTQVLQPIFTKKGNICIEKGFHSYRNLGIAKDYIYYDMFNLLPEIIVKCIVPKGSEYYINNKEMVSNQIIIVERCA